MSDENLLKLVGEIRNWVRAASYASVKSLLETSIPDEKSRNAYQMFDGVATTKQIRIACKMSPNSLLALIERWTAMGLMELNEDNKRVKLFDLEHFGLIGDGSKKRGADSNA